LALLSAFGVRHGLFSQAVAALSPFFMEAYKIGIADIGLLIGLYLATGIFLALPGGPSAKTLLAKSRSFWRVADEALGVDDRNRQALGKCNSLPGISGHWRVL